MLRKSSSCAFSYTGLRGLLYINQRAPIACDAPT